MKTVEVTDAQITMLIEIDGQVHLIAMEKENYAVLSEMVKRSIATVVPTARTQTELRSFFGMDQGDISTLKAR